VSDLPEAALAYAAAGIPVFPLHSPCDHGCSCRNPTCDNVGKHPRTPRGLHDATVDMQQVTEWWQRWPDANIGIPTGAASGYVVLDVDPRHGGNSSFAKLEKAHGRISTARSLTGSGGAHHWFRRGETEIRNSAGTIGDGLDLRGDGGYVVAPPSVHLSGNPYRWIRRLEDGVDDQQDWLRTGGNGSAATKVDQVIPEGKRRAACSRWPAS